ncbi:MAG: hypothetical protein R6X02_21705 [Enhygromyxa sp.]
MKSLRLGPWLLVPWYEPVVEGRHVELDQPADAARLLRRSLDATGTISMRAFVRELDPGAPLDFYDGELLERLAVMIARRRVQLYHLEELPMCSDPIELVEYTPEPAPREDIIDEVELVDWTTELEAEEPVWFETACEADEPVQFEIACEVEELAAFSTELSSGS